LRIDGEAGAKYLPRNARRTERSRKAANRTSAGLPARFILISGAILPRVLLNVALTTVLLTHGMAMLFLLWYITPRSIFEPERNALGGAGN
jgi:hypothetical protein